MASDKARSLPAFKILLAFVCVTLAGIFLVSRLPLKLAPDESLPAMSVSFSMRNATARVVEMTVTSKLEALISRVKGVQSVSSTSNNGGGWISVRLNKHVDIEAARFELAALIRQTYPSFPPEVSYPSLSAQRSDDESVRPFLSYTLNAPSSPLLIQQYAEQSIIQVLSSLKGIDKVEVSGATGMVWQLTYDFDQLKQLGLTTGDLSGAIQGYLHRENMGMGLTEGPTEELTEGETDGRRWIRLVLEPEPHGSSFDPSTIVVANKAGKLIRLDELVKVAYVEDQPSGYYRINGLNSVYLSVTARPEANQLDLAKKVKATLAELEARFPPNYEMHLSYDATEHIKGQLNTILFRSGLTILILLGFVLLIYRNRRYLLMIAASLVGSLSLAVVCYYLMGMEMHLYSLMGVTISLSLMLDNIIVMADQIHRQKNRNAFLAILTSTLTTMAALVMIFFLDEKLRLNLQDFAMVLLINLGVSLLVVLWLVPALMMTMRLGETVKHPKRKRLRRSVKVRRLYRKLVLWLNRRRRWVLLVAVLLFGLPVFLLPGKLQPEKEDPGLPVKVYNATLGSTFYQETLKPVVDKVLGGTLRLFVKNVVQGSYWRSGDETTISVSLNMPNGSTLDQTDFLIGQMETYLRQFKEVKQFQTYVRTRDASIDIAFVKEHQHGSFPYLLKNELISKSIELGGGSWDVYGMGDGFSNRLYENAGSNRIRLTGYNYDALATLAETVRDTLLGYRRIKEVSIGSRFSYSKDDYEEYTFQVMKDRLIEAAIQPMALFGELTPLYQTRMWAGNWVTPSGSEPIRLRSKQAATYDVWHLEHVAGVLDGRQFHMGDLAQIGKYQAPQTVVRENQQYVMGVQYEYIGSYEQSNRVKDKVVKQFDETVPLGFKVESASYSSGWGDTGKGKQYWLLFMVVVIIYFTTSILFNSLKQPLIILLLIPISYVGLFLTFLVFKLNFDQGGFAAFVLLTGITVNAGIFLINQYNQVQRACPQPPIRAYLRAWNLRAVPIMLTLLSTVLGFVPFLLGEKEGFWFPLAAGTIGGLVFSLLGLFVFLPAFMGLGIKNHRKRR